MKLVKSLSSSLRSLIEAAGRVFTRSDDKYPATGVQPFDGDPNRKRDLNH